MLIDAPPFALFLLIPLVVALPFALAAQRVGGNIAAGVLAAVTATIISVGIGVWLVGYGATGTSLAFGFTFVQYLPLCVLSVVLWVWLAGFVRSIR